MGDVHGEGEGKKKKDGEGMTRCLAGCVPNQGIGWFDSTAELELPKSVRRHGGCQCVAPPERPAVRLCVCVCVLSGSAAVECQRDCGDGICVVRVGENKQTNNK